MKQLHDKASAIFLLALFIFQSFWPSAAMALTDKGVQPEFASYEEMGTTDMVNLITGDFTYSLPLVNVPSPEGGFQMPLSYHAGIQVDEESSWVGLGWGLNPGVLNRNISIYPDDYDGTESIVTYADIQSGGGNGYRMTGGMTWGAYDSNEGESSGFQFGNIIGFSQSEASGVGFNTNGLAISKNSVNFDVISHGLAQQEVGLMIVGECGLIGSLFSTGIGVMQAIDAFSAAKKAQSAQVSNPAVVKMETTKEKGFMSTFESYKYWFEGSGTVKPLGVLHLGNFAKTTNPYTMPPTWNVFGHGELVANGTNAWPSPTPGCQPKLINYAGPASSPIAHDFHVYYENDKPLSNQFNPNSLAYDGFEVRAGGASGSISPFRLDIGSLAGPIMNTHSTHNTYNLTSYLKNKTKTETTGYKVPFRYLGDPSNSYDFNVTRSTLWDPSINNYSITTNFGTDWNETHSNFFQVSLADPKIFCDDLPSGSGRTAKEGNRVSVDPNISTQALYNDQLVHRKHIAWFSNHEIVQAQTNNFMDCGVDRTNFPENGIGGFSITREDGLTYHFTVPVYNRSEFKKIKKYPGPDKYLVANGSPYATSWLLTGITGADFVDRGVVGRIDDQDWGYWVKLDYGMYNNNYAWRIPYHGWQTPAPHVYQFERGLKQTYYLNTIKTRSHTALFLKSPKNDGKSYYETDNSALESGESGTDWVPDQVSNALKLDNIIIMRNADYDQLATTPSYNLSKLNNITYNHSSNWATSVDNINANVILSNDFNYAAFYFMQQNQVEAINFEYDYALCPYTLNSWVTGGAAPWRDSFTNSAMTPSPLTGKLTLRKVRTLGPNSSELIPPYLFFYGSNPRYADELSSTDLSDDFGFYKASNNAGTTLTNCKNPGPGGDEWSLKTIHTPLGAIIDVQYERDTYSSVNGLSNGWYTMKIDMAQNSGNWVNSVSGAYRVYSKPCYGKLTNYLKVGNIGFLEGQGVQSFNFTVSGIDPAGNYFDFTSNDPSASTYIGLINQNASNAPLLGMVTGLDSDNPRYGGDIRVKEITTTDNTDYHSPNKYVTRYDYHNSGVASFEPASTKIYRKEYERLFDHPNFPILYGKVSVSKGRMNGSVYEENNKSVYKYTTPNESFLDVNRGGTISGNTETNDPMSTTLGPYFSDYSPGNSVVSGPQGINHYRWRARSGHIIIKDKTACIGQLKEIVNYNSRNEALSQIKYSYVNGEGSTGDDYISNQTEWSNMGEYAETNFLWEYFNDPQLIAQSKSTSTNSNYEFWEYTYRLYQTTKIKYPSVLKSYTVNVGGVTSTKSITQVDYFTGSPLRTETQIGGPTGEITEVIYTPAYEKHPEMGSKVMDPRYKNIMSATAQEKTIVDYYSYLGSKVTTWSKDVPYRLYNTSTAKYNSVQFPQANSGEIGPYHPHKEYVWKSAVDKDGLIAPQNFVDYNWSGSTQDPRWIKTSEATLYNKYSKLLEGKDVNNRKISSKYIDKGSYQIASLYNCGYGEWCYSGAEDTPEFNYFGGEVSGTQYRNSANNIAHTGSYSLKVPYNGTGFQFSGDYGSALDFKPNKTYRASVWLHVSNPMGRLYCEVRNSSGLVSYTDVQVTSGSTKELYGNWYLLNLDFTTPATVAGTSPYLVFGCRNAGKATMDAYFDDFRVQPIDAATEINVIDPKTGNLVAKLDEENIATRYYYDDKYRLTRIEKESKAGFTKLSTHETNHKH